MTIIMLPLVISMLLYYLIKPLVLLVERTGLNRTMSILVIYAILGLLLVWGISTAIPSLQNQILILIKMHHHILHVPIVRRNVGLIFPFFPTSTVI